MQSDATVLSIVAVFFNSAALIIAIYGQKIALKVKKSYALWYVQL